MLTIRNKKKKSLSIVSAELVLVLPMGPGNPGLIPLPYDRVPNIWRQTSSALESNYIENGGKIRTERKGAELVC